jgi:rhodanese-related sulfurtransferase
MVDERSFEAEVLREQLPVLIAFTSERSTAHPKLLAELEAVANELIDKAKVVMIDAVKSQFLAKQLRVQSVPTLLVFAAGRIADMQVGLLAKKQLLAMLEPFLPRAAGAIKPAELAQLVAKKAVVPVDTRDAAAFGRAHLPGAVHMELSTIEGRIAELYMLAGPAVLYCRAGDKVAAAIPALLEQGVEIGYLEGGLLAWESLSLPIEKPILAQPTHAADVCCAVPCRTPILQSRVRILAISIGGRAQQ